MRLSFASPIGIGSLLLMIFLLGPTRSSHAAIDDVVTTIAVIVDRAVDAARRAGAAIRSLDSNPLDDRKRARFQRDLGNLGGLLNELGRKFRENQTPRQEIQEAQERLIGAFEQTAGRNHVNIIRDTLNQVGWGQTLEFPEGALPLPSTRGDLIVIEVEPRSSAPTALGAKAPPERSTQPLAYAQSKAAERGRSRTSSPPRISESLKVVKAQMDKAEIAATKTFRQIDLILTQGTSGSAAAPTTAFGTMEPLKVSRRPRGINGGVGASSTSGDFSTSDVQRVDGPFGSITFNGIGGRITQDPEAIGDEAALESEMAGLTIHWPEGRGKSRRHSTDLTPLTAAEVAELVEAKGKRTLLIVIAAVVLSIWAFYLGLMFRARQRSSFPRLSRGGNDELF